MAWTQGENATPSVRVRASGQIRFSEAAFHCLGDGDALRLGVLYDAETNRLGFRRGTDCNSVCVLLNEDMVHAIDAEALLESLGVTIEEGVTLELHAPAPFVPPDNPGDDGIWWVQLP